MSEILSNYETLRYEEADGVGWITLDRPDALNAFDATMQDELYGLWRALRDRDEVRAVVLTGAGDRAFCAGIDRSVMAHRDTSSQTEGARVGRGSTPFHFEDPGAHIGPKSCDLWKPVVAAVNGMACGGAFYLLGEVDIVVAADHATFFDPHVTYGMAASFESTHLLQKVPLHEVLRIALLGSHERVSAERAHQIGLVSQVVPADELRDAATWVAEAIASAPPLAVQATLRAIWTAHEHNRSQALGLAYAFIGLGTDWEAIDAGQDAFKTGKRIEWKLR